MTDPTLRRLRRGRLFIVLVAVAALLVLGSRVLAGLYVDALWYQEVGYSSVFWKNLAWVWGVRAAMALLVGLSLFVNLRVVAASLGTLQIRRRFGNLEIAERLPTHYVSWGVAGLSAVLGLWFGASVPDGVARSFLLWLHAPEWGMVDPFLGRDLGHFVFTVPVLRAGVTFGLVIAFLLVAVTLAGYATTGTLQVGQRGLVVTQGARRHLGILLGCLLLLLAARFALGRSLLLLDGSSDIVGLFGYADHAARLPALRILAVVAVLGAAGVIAGSWKGQLVPAMAGLGALVLGGLLGGQLYPSLVQRFVVVPNQLERETPYIEENIRFTRLGFDLRRMERDELDTRLDAEVDWSLAPDRFQGLPVWSAWALLQTFRERQARFQYYDFSPPQVDRYATPDGVVPVALSVREVDQGGIEDQNWQNLHLRERFVVGNGVVAVAATDRTEEWGPRAHIAGIPPELSQDAPVGLELDRASVFFATRSQRYAVITPTDTTFLAPDGRPGVAGVDFPGGIPMGGLLRKLLVAWDRQEANFLFAGEVEADSRLVLHRSVVERARRIAPFLRYPELPYPVVHEGRVVWVLEGFTGTRYFPLARPFNLELRQPVAYARASVKVVVDGVTGQVDLYALPEPDPLRDAWMSVFPGVIEPLEEMPVGLRSHLRYPEALLNLQSQVLLQYHQGTAQMFFEQEEQWALSQELSQDPNRPVGYRPEYAILQLPGDDEAHFQISTVFVPAGRDNLTGLLSGRIDAGGRTFLRLLDFPISQELRGPRQVEALVEQDPVISQQFSLWRQGGSEVWTGHLHVIPVGDRVLYMEPIFLAADANAIPELRRFVVSDGERVSMEETLAGAVAALAGESLRASPLPAAAEGEVGATPGLRVEDALTILDRAEASLREGDFAGFGAALEELRRALESLAGSGTGPVESTPTGG
jgi:uncharacterized membrane protein (UPF0182 family)